MSKRSQPICIVGAGPAGLVSALTLVERGILPVIFEKSSGHRSRSRATGLQSDTLKSAIWKRVCRFDSGRGHH